LRAAVFLSGPSEDRTVEFYDGALNRKEIPHFNEIIRLHEESKLNLPRWKIGLGFMQTGLELVQHENFLSSFERLKSGITLKLEDNNFKY
jgi:hypothetical protein